MKKRYLGIAILVFIFLGIGIPISQGKKVPIKVKAPPALNFSSDTPSFMLSFSDFTSGSVSDTATVTYTISANKVKRDNNVVLAHLDSLFTGIDVEADMGPYTKVGGNASLVEVQAGYVVIPTSDVGLANKIKDKGSGKVVEGNFPITFRAVATEDLAAGNETVTLVVTFIDT